MRRVESKGAKIETLENRTLMSGVPLAVAQVAAYGQTELKITSISGNDHITLSQTPAGLVVGNTGKWSTTVTGSFDRIVIRGGRGNDSILVDSSVKTDCTIFGGNGKNVLQAGGGNDTLVSLGSKADTLIGGTGRDSFWADNSTAERIVNLTPVEINGGDVHRVSGISASAVRGKSKAVSAPLAVSAEPAADPGDVYKNFSDHPLFSAVGPAADDVVQGNVGDCFYLATLSATAKTDPWRIRESILDMGDGTYVVQFARGGRNVYLRVDGSLPTTGGSNLAYADFGAGSSIWVGVMEKAYALFHSPSTGYASLDGGWMDDAFASLGASASSEYTAAIPESLLGEIQQKLAQGQAVTYAAGTPADGAPLLDQHAYSVDRVNVDSHGNAVSLTLRNPWGIDGAGNDGNNDGYVTVTAQQAYDSMLGIVSAAV